ncbi:hypothetical protein CHS0354_008692 [Potamilus streckersoni]|uniref:Uncharacterized protein n=1 Tax=Potamilus streckersoni TaxID=2493646 RepID=A0AAE0TIT6_9BIVA|nr:hypothetical protein CHS0354_008692 [Potamilus streckersoni]
MLRSSFGRLARAYPSLNLVLNVSKDLHEVGIVLPGLRFDDIDHTGQPDIMKMLDMLNHVETAALYHDVPFLDYKCLRKQNISSHVKAAQMEIRSDFYEITTPKAPLQVQIRLSQIGETTFTTHTEMYCAGRAKESILIKNMHAFVNSMSNEPMPVPDWWRNRFDKYALDKDKTPLTIKYESMPSNSHQISLQVPLSDTDVTERTRCASYVKYFLNNASIASNKSFFKNLKTTFHEFHLKKLYMLYFGPSFWGDSVTSYAWEEENPLILHCSVKKDEMYLWYGRIEFYNEVFGLYPQTIVSADQHV